MDQARIRLSSYGSGKVTLEGLTPTEVESIQRMVAGLSYLRVNDEGRLDVRAGVLKLPKWSDDELLPYWRLPEAVQTQLVNPIRNQEDIYSPSIYIQSLCGYNYTKSNYIECGKSLERFGFKCMRSRRGSDGKFWEVWYLPGLWAAKDEMKEALGSTFGADAKTRARLLKTAIEFLREWRNVPSGFGTLDATAQRLAMVMD